MGKQKSFTDYIGGEETPTEKSTNKDFIDYTFAPTRNVNTTEASGYETFEGDSKYDQGLVHGYDQNALRGYNQPWTHEFGNALGQIALNTVPTIVGNVASILDFEDYFNTDNEIGNGITRAMEAYKQSVSQDVAPIYQQNPNATMDLGNSEWWNRAFADTGTSAAAFVGTGLLTGGAFGAAGRILSTSSKLAQYGEAGQAAATVLNAVALNQAESIPIAMNVYDDVYGQAQEQVKQGSMTDEEARQKAADAGAYSINMNRANVLLNLTSSGMFIKNPAMTRKLVDQVALKNTFKTLASEGLQEATEEVINLGAEATAKEYGKVSLQDKDYNSAIQDFANAVFTKQGLESAFLGAIGGMAQQGASMASKAIQGDYKAQQDQFIKQQQYLADLDVAQTANGGLTSNRFLNTLSRTSDLSKQYQEAIDNNDLNEAEAISNKALNDQAFEAYSLGTTEQLEDMYKKMEALPIEEATTKQLDTQPDSPFYYKKRTQEALKTIKENEGLYSTLANQYGFSENLTQTAFNNRTQASHYEKKAGEIISKISDLDNKKAISDLPYSQKAAAIESELAELHELRGNAKKDISSAGLQKDLLKKELVTLGKKLVELDTEYTKITSPEAIKEAKQVAKEKLAALKPKKVPKVVTSVEGQAETKVAEEKIRETIPQAEYEDFLNNGVVSEDTLYNISDKIANGTTFEELSDNEKQIFTAKTSEINNLLEQRKPTETTTNKGNVNTKTKEKIVKEDANVADSIQVKMNPKPVYFKNGVMTTPVGVHAKAYPEFTKGRKILLQPNKTPQVRVEVNTKVFKEDEEYTPDTIPLVFSVKGDDGKYHRFSNVASEASKMKHQEKEIRAKLWNTLVDNPSDKGPRIVTINKSDFEVVLNKKFKANQSENFEYTLDNLFKKSPEYVNSNDKINPTIVVLNKGKGKSYTGTTSNNITSKDEDNSTGVFFTLIQPNGIPLLTELKYDGNTSDLISKLEAGEDVSKKLKTNIYPKEPFMVTSFFIDNGFDNPPISKGKVIIGVEGDRAKIATGTEVKPIDTASEIQWIKDHLPADIPAEVVEDIQVIASHGAEEAWGLFKKGVIYLTEKAGEGTGYHEAFHAVFRLMMDDTKIQSILDEAKTKYPKLKNKSDLEIEEFLADKFAEYVINKQETNVKGNGIKAFFQRLWNWAKNLINRSDIDKLFQNIERKKFKVPGIKRSINRFTSSATEFSYPVYKKIVPELTLDQEQRRFNNVHYLYTQSILENDRVKHPDNTDSVNIIYNEMDSKQKLEFYEKAFTKLQEVVKGLPEASKAQAGILADNFDLFVSEHEGYMQAFNEGILSPDIHQYLSELYQYVPSEDGSLTEATDELGLPIYEDFDKNFHILYSALKDVSDINQAVEIVNDLAVEHPQFQKIVKDLLADNSRLNNYAFLQSFSGNTGKLQASTYKTESAVETPYKEYKELAYKAQANIELDALKNGDPIKLKFFEDVSNKLTSAFAKAGYSITVKTDSNLTSRGKISIDNKTKTASIVLGNDATYETIAEEFSHLYLAALGYDSPLMREGIATAKKSRPELWKKIQEVYDGEPLEVQEEELISKLMADEGVKILTSSQPSPLKYWINKIIRAVSEYLGIPVNSAKYLFQDMLDGKFNGKNVRRGTDIRFDKGGEDNKELSTLTKTLKQYKKTLDDRIDAVSKLSNENALKQDKLRYLKGLKNSLAKLNEEEQFAKILYFANKDLDNIIEEFEGYEDRLGSVEYAQFVHNNNAYLNSFKILSAPVDAYKNDRSLKSTVGKINEKINELAQLNKKGLYAQIETLVKEYSTNPNIDEAAIRGLIEGTVDISTFQFQFGALASSEDLLLALADKRLKLQKQKTRQFSNTLKETMVILRDNLFRTTNSHEQPWMKQKDSKGNETGKIVDRVAYSYNQEGRKLRDAVTKDGKRLEYVENPATQEEINYNIDLANKNQALDDFYDPDSTDNHVYANEFIEERNHFEDPIVVDGKVVGWDVKEEFIEEDEDGEEVYTPEYLAYRDKYYNNLGDKLTPVAVVDEAGNKHYTGEVVSEPTFIVKQSYKEVTDKWIDQDWQAIQSDPTKKEFYDFYSQTMEDAVDKIPTGAFSSLNIPSVFKSMAEILVDSPEKIQLMGSMCTDFFKVEDRTLNGKKQVPLHFTSILQDESLTNELKEKLATLDPVDDKVQYDSITARIKTVEGRRKTSDVSNDFFHILESFATTAQNYQNLQEIEGTLNIIKDVVENRDIYETDSKGNQVYEDEAGTIPKVKPGKLSRAARRYNDWLEAVFYEEPLPQGTLDKVAEKFMRYTSLRSLGLNMYSGINNLVVGGIQQNIEAIGGQFFTKEQYGRATKEFGKFLAKDMFTHLSNDSAHHTGKYSSKMMAAIDKFDVMVEQSEGSRGNDSGGRRILKSILGMNWMFITLNIGEVSNQSRLGTAMLMNEELTNSITQDKSSVWDAMELVDGKLVFKEGYSMTDREMANLSEKIRGVNQMIHGRYTKEDVSRLQRYTIGKLCFHMRKWLAPAIESRFRKKYYDERIQKEVSGRYLSLWKLISDVHDYQGNVMKAWSTMTDLEKANNKKNLAELCYFFAAFAGAQLLSSIAANIPEEDVILKKTANFLVYQDKRLIGELSQFANPLAMADMIRQPIPMVDVIKQGSKFMLELVKAPVDMAEGHPEELYYTSGQNEGRTKVLVEGYKALPVLNQIEKWINLSDQNNEFYIK